MLEALPGRLGMKADAKGLGGLFTRPNVKFNLVRLYNLGAPVVMMGVFYL